MQQVKNQPKKEAKNKSEYEWLHLSVIECDNCGKTANITDTARILERKKGVFTGREFNLCPKCRFKYMQNEIKNVNLKLDQKYKLHKWNEGIRTMSS